MEEREINEVSRLYRALAESFAAILIRELGDQITSIALYGSVARGMARPESDIDVFVVAGKAETERDVIRRRIMDLEYEFWNGDESESLREQGYRASVETLVVSEAHARRGFSIYLDMTLEAVVLYDPSGFFAQRMEQVKARMAELKSRREWIDDDCYVWRLKGDMKLGEIFQLPYIEDGQV